jgi:hypothetical protein
MAFQSTVLCLLSLAPFLTFGVAFLTPSLFSFWTRHPTEPVIMILAALLSYPFVALVLRIWGSGAPRLVRILYTRMVGVPFMVTTALVLLTMLNQ